MTARDRVTGGAADLGLPGGPGDVEVRRSKRRTRTVSAYRERGRIVVLIPGRFSAAQEERWVTDVVQQLLDRERQRARTEDELMTRAEELNAEYFDGQLAPFTVTWSSRQRRVWGTCNTETGRIRLAETLQQFPVWVQDYVLMHELAHLVEPDHCAAFWELVGQYPLTERARGFLEGVSAAADQLSAADLAQWASPGTDRDAAASALDAAGGDRKADSGRVGSGRQTAGQHRSRRAQAACSTGRQGGRR